MPPTKRSSASGLSLPKEILSPNCDARPDGAAVDVLVIHYTGMQSAEAALARLTDPASQVSAHYLIDEDGSVIRLVPEEKRAWHAGVSSWRGRAGVNATSIGIELVNPGHEFGYRAFPEPQMAALEVLSREIVARHAIAPRNIVGHSDVAPIRKCDPGELFDWPRLAAAGVGLWPPANERTPAPEDQVAPLLAAFGYDVADLRAAVVAFQRHFARHRLDGVADPATRRILAALIAEIS
jgi:N-acetylmuramoyl-L-alanine amidase